MSQTDILTDEKHEPNSKPIDEDTKLSSLSKCKCDKVPKNSNSKNESSNFLRCKKSGPLKRNLAQDRLKRLRANIELQKRIKDELCSEIISSKHEKNNSTVSFQKCLPDNNNIKKKRKTESSSRPRYSAAARLQKIRAAFLLKLEDKEDTDVVPVKLTDNCSNEKHLLPDSVNDVGVEENACIDQKEKRTSDCGSSMDVDLDSEYPCVVKKVTDNSNRTPCEPDEWSDSLEENTAYFANEISKYRSERAYLALHENLFIDVVMNLAVPVGDLFIVIDTNIFLSHLSFVRKLLTCDVSPYKKPVIVIPWLVLQEIDYATKKKDPQLSSRARSANIFIYDYLKKKHPRMFGQSLEDFKQNFKNATGVDDYILQYCLKFVSLENNVILLTDDINLCNKSMVNQLNVFTKKEFQKNFGVMD